MANVNKPFGLRPSGNLSATGAQKQYGYQIADNQSGAIFQGDLVGRLFRCLLVAFGQIFSPCHRRSDLAYSLLSRSINSPRRS